MLKVHDFKEQLEFSEAHELFWREFYRKAFLGCTIIIRNQDSIEGQRRGIDRIVIDKYGVQSFCIEEKMREKSYDDFLLEYISNDRTNVPGWMERDLLSNFLAYAFAPKRKGYLIPWQPLKSFWIAQGERLKKHCEPISAVNASYTTWSVAVPIKTLRMEIPTIKEISLLAPVCIECRRAGASIQNSAHCKHAQEG